MTRPHPDLPKRAPLAEHRPGTRNELVTAANIDCLTENA